MKFQKFNDLTARNKPSRPKEIFQALFYCSLLKTEDTYQEKNLIPGLYAMRSLEDGLLQPYISLQKNHIEGDDQYLGYMNDIITELLTELFDPKVEFVSTKNKDNCKFCSFQAYCQKN